MTIQHGGRGGKSRNGLQPVHGSGNEVVSLTGIPGPITESLRCEFSKEIVAVFRRANVSPALIYAFSKTGLVVTEENRGREDCPRDLARGAARLQRRSRVGDDSRFRAPSIRN